MKVFPPGKERLVPERVSLQGAHPGDLVKLGRIRWLGTAGSVDGQMSMGQQFDTVASTAMKVLRRSRCSGSFFASNPARGREA